MAATEFDNLFRLKNVTPTRTHILKKAPATNEPMIPAILELEENADVDSLASLGIVIFYTRANMALASLPVSLADEGLLDGVRRICASRSLTGQLDRSRAVTGIDDIHRGLASGIGPYSGRGIVAGICDVGIDPNHIAFRDPVTGQNRINHIVSYHESEGRRDVITPDKYETWATDSATVFHATHVAGIFAGSYFENGLQGIAPEAELVVTVSELSDVGILAGAEDVISYARETGRPAVINMSLGSYLGPHDGTTLFNRYLSLLGEEAVICLAAGNEGSRNNSVVYTVPESGREAVVTLCGNDWVHFNLNGYVDVWSDTDEPIELTLGVVSSASRSLIDRVARIEIIEGELCGITTDEDDCGMSPYIKYVPELSQYFQGAILAVGEVNPYNNRYNVTLLVSTHSDAESPQGPWALFHPALIVGGDKGRQINVFSDSQRILFYSIPGEVTPGSTMSISDLATGYNVIAVGMSTTRSEVTTLDGVTTVYPNYVDNTVNQSSSYGTLGDGRVLPHVVAPGATIISAMSTPYLQRYPEALAGMVDRTVKDGREWYWVNESGTSMATPFTAGTIALWLEAVPSLDVDDVIDVLLNTNDINPIDPSNPRHGRGWLQPVEGLKYLLANYSAGVTDVDVPTSPIIIGGNRVDILAPDALPASVNLYDSTGRRVDSELITSTATTTIGDNLPAGIYIVTVTPAGGYRAMSAKLAVSPK
ncbi:MAG: S8 family peptidase [Muribaculaceae bacterium]|nr:S8 family peptidase [Muribaculaceae bacterium]